MRTTLLSSLLVAMVGCGAAPESPSVATAASAMRQDNQELQPSAVPHAHNELFYEIDENGAVLKFEVPPYLAEQIANAYGKPELAAVLRAQIEEANLKLAPLDTNEAFDAADAIVEALNGELHQQLHADPRRMVFAPIGALPYAGQNH
jgi:hypothetical protein